MIREALGRVRPFVFRALPPPIPILHHFHSASSLARWTRTHPAPVTVKHRFALYDIVNADIRGGQIDYLEFGVMHGRSLKKWLLINTHHASRFIGFDSFEGLPEAWDGGTTRYHDKGEFSVGGRVPQLDDPRVRFIKGWFQDTLGPFLESFQPEAPLVIHHDSDLYSSTLYCLTMLDRIAAPGTVLIFDEFHSAAHEFRAFMDYTAAYRRRYAVLAAVGRMPCLQIAIRLE